MTPRSRRAQRLTFWHRRARLRGHALSGAWRARSGTGTRRSSASACASYDVTAHHPHPPGFPVYIAPRRICAAVDRRAISARCRRSTSSRRCSSSRRSSFSRASCASVRHRDDRRRALRVFSERLVLRRRRVQRHPVDRAGRLRGRVALSRMPRRERVSDRRVRCSRWRSASVRRTF